MSSPDVLSNLPEGTWLRLLAHATRAGIELCAASAYALQTDTAEVQSDPKARLLLLLPPPGDPSWDLAYRSIKAARNAYKASSDLLHGRASASHVTAARVAEWEAACGAVQVLYRERLGHSSPKAVDPRRLAD